MSTTARKIAFAVLKRIQNENVTSQLRRSEIILEVLELNGYKTDFEINSIRIEVAKEAQQILSRITKAPEKQAS